MKTDTEIVYELYSIKSNLCDKYCNCSNCPAKILINFTNAVCQLRSVISRLSKPTTCKFCDWSPDGCLCKSPNHKGFYCNNRFNQIECKEYVNEDES